MYARTPFADTVNCAAPFGSTTTLSTNFVAGPAGSNLDGSNGAACRAPPRAKMTWPVGENRPDVPPVTTRRSVLSSRTVRGEYRDRGTLGCQEDGAIVTDLTERFCDLDVNQSEPWNTVAWTAGVPPITNRMFSHPPACPSLSGPISNGLTAHAASLVSVRS